MRTIRINWIRMVNFRGFTHTEIAFNPFETVIRGKNRAGKSTVFNAFLWALFFKDSEDRKDFDIKRRNPDGSTTDKQNAEVSLSISEGKTEHIIKHLLVEKWSTQRGSKDEKFVGNEHELYWNDVPMKMKEFQEKIGALIEERLFKLLTNPLYFNSLKWEDRRSILIDIAGKIDENEVWQEVAKEYDVDRVQAVLDVLSTGKRLDEYRREIVSKKNKIKGSIGEISPRIDEALRKKPEPKDFDQVEADIASKKQKMEDLDAKISDISAIKDEAEKLRSEKRKQFHDLCEKRDTFARKVRREVSMERESKVDEAAPVRQSIQNTRALISQLERAIKASDDSINAANKRKAELLEQWKTENARVVDYSKIAESCVECKRPYDVEKTESQKVKTEEAFNLRKKNALDNIKTSAENIKTEVATYNEQKATSEAKKTDQEEVLKGLLADLEKIEAKKVDLKPISEVVDELLIGDSNYIEILAGIKDVEAELSKPVESNEQDEQIRQQAVSEKRTIMSEIEALTTDLAVRKTIEETDARVEELKKQQRTLASELADNESIDFVIEKYTKVKMTLVENRVNSKFEMAQFKMFMTQINEGERAICETSYNGVPWGTLNSAGRIQVGLDIIKTLSNHYQVSAPIFIDNRESTTEIPYIDAQIINLKVDPDAEGLEVS